MTEKNTLISNQLARYYALVAAQHERGYAQPQCQSDLEQLHQKVAEALRGHKVLELACGGGYWSAIIARTAASLLATDINPEMLELARARGLANVAFSLADAFDLPADLGEFTAVFAGFWWSHVPREEQDRFLAQLRAKLGQNIFLVLLDDTYVEGNSASIARTDAEGNTYQILRAPDGQRYEVLKNFPSDSTLRKKIGASVREICITRLEYYWMLSCRLK